MEIIGRFRFLSAKQRTQVIEVNEPTLLIIGVHHAGPFFIGIVMQIVFRCHMFSPIGNKHHQVVEVVLFLCGRISCIFGLLLPSAQTEKRVLCQQLIFGIDHHQEFGNFLPKFLNFLLLIGSYHIIEHRISFIGNDLSQEVYQINAIGTNLIKFRHCLGKKERCFLIKISIILLSQSTPRGNRFEFKCGTCAQDVFGRSFLITDFTAINRFQHHLPGSPYFIGDTSVTGCNIRFYPLVYIHPVFVPHQFK